MNKTVRSLFLVCLVLLLSLLMVACGSDDTTPSKNLDGGNQPTPTTTAHTHNFTPWTLVTDFTCTQDGLEERTCACGEKEQQSIPSPGHIPGEWVIFEDATATESGERRVYCLVCDSILQVEVIPATGTTGLDYRVNEDGVSCTVTGIGSCTDSQLVIGATIDGYAVTAIGAWAFEMCKNLNSVTISDSVTTIGDGAFSECTGLTSVILPSSLTAIPGNLFSHCSKLQSIVIPNGVTTIGYDAFGDCTALSGITIPESVTYISTIAFSGCTALHSITIPENVTYIGEHVFEDTGYYKNEANWENDMLYIGAHLVAVKETLSGNHTVKAGTRTICAWAFRDCTNLTGITVPDSVVGIGDNAFSNCSNLTSISIPDSLQYMKSSSFYGTGYYNDASNWENDVLYVGNHLVATMESFSGEYAIKPGTLTIADWAFSSRSGLTGITIPEGVHYIGDNAFSSCTGLTTVVIPNSVTIIGNNAFSNCSNLTSITLSNRITSIGYGTFFRCYQLANITIPESVTYIDDSAFSGCSNLVSIIIPNSVTYIGNSAFRNCTNLFEITLSNGITSIGASAFDSCWYLANIIIPDSVTYIGREAFKDCHALKSITIPGNVTSIGICVFEACNNLTSITISSSVKRIDASAFFRCGNLVDIYYTGTKEQWAAIDTSIDWTGYVIHCTDGDITK